MLVIGITGTIGAGKGTVVDYLTGKKGFSHFSVRGYLIRHFSVRGYLIREIKKRGLVVDRNSI